MLSLRSLRRRYHLLLAVRWLGVGLIIPVQVLLPMSRGLTLAQVGLVLAMQGFVALALELPTGGLSDSWGRRPVLLLAGCVGLAATTTFLFAHSLALFALASVLAGVFRALDSGPLEAWFVDTVHTVEPDHPIEKGLSAASAVTGFAVAAGSGLAGALVTLLPVAEPMTVPVVASLAAQAVLIPAVALLLRETHGGGGGVPLLVGLRGVGATVASGLSLVSRSKVLVALLGAELLWSFGMPAFESILPARLAEFLADPAAAAALLGPVGAASWAAMAVGAWGAAFLGGRLGVARASVLLRLVQGASVLGMGLVGGVVGLLTALLACYLVHGASNPLHSTLLHRQVGRDHRATVLSMNSMVSQTAGSIGLIVLSAVAEGISTGAAFVVAAVALVAGAPLYRPAARAERSLQLAGAATVADVYPV